MGVLKDIWEDKVMRWPLRIFIFLVMAALLYLLGRLIYKSHAGEKVETPIWNEPGKQQTIPTFIDTSKQLPFPQPKRQTQPKTDNSTKNNLSNSGVKNYVGRDNNGGHVGDIINPVDSSRAKAVLVDANKPGGGKYITEWEVVVERGNDAVSQIKFILIGNNIVDFTGAFENGNWFPGKEKDNFIRPTNAEISHVNPPSGTYHIFAFTKSPQKLKLTWVFAK